jgi:enoyl-CoA hydratase
VSEVLTVERRGRVALAVLDRPDRLNALNVELVGRLQALAGELEADAATRVLVVTGAGRAFCAGADIAELDALDGPLAFSRHVRRMTDALGRLHRLPQPTVAAINGLALGGGLELALACDLRLATREATLGVPEVKLGLLPAAGGSQRLARFLPPAIAKHLLMTGDPISAEVALAHGLINEVVDGGVLDAALALAARLAVGPPLALAAAKRLVDEGGQMGLEGGIVFERETISTLFGTEDRREGTRAFLEKRTPTFEGR